MTKKQIKTELMRFNRDRPFISLTGIAQAMRVGKDSARSMVKGLPYIQNGNRKDYLIEDIANLLAEEAHTPVTE